MSLSVHTYHIQCFKIFEGVFKNINVAQGISLKGGEDSCQSDLTETGLLTKNY